METLAFILAALFISTLGYLAAKLMVSFAKMDEKSRKIFKQKQNEKNKI